MQTEQFVHRVCDLGNPVLRHEPRQALGEIVVLQNLLHEVAIKDCPRPGVLWRMRLQAGGQFLRHNMRAGAGLAGNRYGVMRPAISVSSQPLSDGFLFGRR